MQERPKSLYVVFAIAAALIVPAAIALRTVVHPAILQSTSDNPTPLGYTWSLALFIIPIGVLAWGFSCRPDLKFLEKHFGGLSRCSHRSVSRWISCLATLSSSLQT